MNINCCEEANRVILKAKDCISAVDLVTKLSRFVVADLSLNDKDIYIVVTPNGIKVEKYNFSNKEES